MSDSIYPFVAGRWGATVAFAAGQPDGSIAFKLSIFSMCIRTCMCASPDFLSRYVWLCECVHGITVISYRI